MLVLFYAAKTFMNLMLKTDLLVILMYLEIVLCQGWHNHGNIALVAKIIILT